MKVRGSLVGDLVPVTVPVKAEAEELNWETVEAEGPGWGMVEAEELD